MPRITKLTPRRAKTKSGHILSEKEEHFCKLFATFVPRIEAVVEAYKVDKRRTGWRCTASSIATENLLRPYINERIRELMVRFPMTDEDVDNELEYIIRQNAELVPKNIAIKEYNTVKGRHKKDEGEIIQNITFKWQDGKEGGNNNSPVQSPPETKGSPQLDKEIPSSGVGEEVRKDNPSD